VVTNSFSSIKYKYEKISFEIFVPFTGASKNQTTDLLKVFNQIYANMNKNIFRLMLLLIISVGLLTTAAAQSKAAKKAAKTPAVFEVNLPISVTDKKKQFVSGLTREDFIVLENGRRQKVTLFADEKNSTPIYVGVLMDTSPSMRAKMDFIKEAAKNLVYSLTRLRKDKAAFLTFDHEINLRQEFTGNIDLLVGAIDGVKETGQQNSLYDAIYQFCDERLRNAPGRRAIIVISDGKDTFSRAELKDVIDIAQRTETVIFIVSTNDRSLGTIQNVKAETVKDMDDEFLLQLTAETGGATFFASSTLELDKAFAGILKELHSQYTLTYRPSNQKYDRKERKIKVRLADGKKNKVYKIRTKTKYRAVKESLK
jgi:Ca-activated chloride channel family protein